MSIGKVEMKKKEIINVAKNILLDKIYKSEFKYTKSNVILANECPVCGKQHNDAYAYYGPELEYMITCPNTGIDIYGIYA